MAKPASTVTENPFPMPKPQPNGYPTPAFKPPTLPKVPKGGNDRPR